MDRRALGAYSCIQYSQREDDQRVDGCHLQHIREALVLKEGLLDDRLFNLKMTESQIMDKHLNEFNIIMT